MIYEVTIGDKTHRVELTRTEEGWQCRLDGRSVPVDVVRLQDSVISLLIDGKSYEVKQELSTEASTISVGRRQFSAVVRDPRSLRSRRRSAGSGEGLKRVTASMPGKVVRVVAPTGTAVEAGQAVLVIEAMKMQNEMKSPKKGTVKKINVSEGSAVEAGQVLAEIE